MREEMLMLAGALLAALLGLAWLALAMDVHWEQVRGRGAPQPRGAVRALRVLGVLALAGSLWLCLLVDHVSMASLVWLMALAAAALTVAFTLSWKPRLLAPLLGPLGRR
ncbi:DUF3325 domain-containing protein [Roseateles sp. DAIF2]|uniref:DUF3325 family protein n=1 Tax=Roseateles sp. DAIF2 TaxID=2714952 RepID=UPI0018A25FBC|nr:DUF3325 family protein [Roseateles sp. DAIF2]QPF73254.1 DUF3325 domain-containing protein [Roseateles sp. DAIF2]